MKWYVPVHSLSLETAQGKWIILASKPTDLRGNYKILCSRNSVYWLKVTVYDWGHVEKAINCLCLLGVRGILGSWETGSFRTKCCAMGQNDGLSHSFTCTCENVFLFVLQRDSNTSYYQISSGETCSLISQTHLKWHKVTIFLLER